MPRSPRRRSTRSADKGRPPPRSEERQARPTTSGLWTERSSGHGYGRKNAPERFAGAYAFEFRFGAEKQSVLYYGRGHGADIVRADEIASGDGGPGAGG